MRFALTSPTPHPMKWACITAGKGLDLGGVAATITFYNTFPIDIGSILSYPIHNKFLFLFPMKPWPLIIPQK